MATACDVIGCGCVAKRHWISIDLVGLYAGQATDNRILDLDRDLCDYHAAGLINAIEGVLAGKTLFSAQGDDHE